MYSMFFLKGKKNVSGNHNNNPPKTSHYFLASGFYISPLCLLLYSLTFPDIWYIWKRYLPSTVPSHAAKKAVFLLLEWIMTLWRRSSHSYVTWNTLRRRASRQRLFFPVFLSLYSVQFAPLLTGVSASWENYTFPIWLSWNVPGSWRPILN